MRAAIGMLAPAIVAGSLWGGGGPPSGAALAPGIVRLTGAAVPAASPACGLARTFSVELTGRASGDTQPPGRDPAALIPPDAVWPDASDRVRARGRREVPAAPNPWEVRGPRGRGREEVVIACGGIICADGGDSVALLNGRTAKAGSVVAGLTVACIAPDAVVLEADGCFYAVPRGRRVTVEL